MPGPYTQSTPAIVAVITAQPDKVAEMRAVMLEGMFGSQNEDGIKMYEACVNLKNPAEFAFIECYKDMQSTATHGKEPHFKTMNKAMRPLIGGKPVLHMLQRSTHAATLAASSGSVITASTIQCIAQLKAAPGKEGVLEKVLAAMVGPSNAEPGCFMYELFTEPKKPGRFTFVEVWKDTAAQAEHSTLPHFKTMGRALKTQGLLGGAPVIRNFQSITATTSKL